MSCRIREAGDSVLILELDERLDPAINAQAILIGESIRTSTLPGLLDVVSGYRSVAVYFDPLRVNLDSLVDTMEQAGRAASVPSLAAHPPITVPACYEGACAPDIGEVAEFAGCSADEVIRLHTSRAYRVFMLGFLPGFPYMGIVDERIGAPRRSTPRVRVPAGMVGVAGRQTGIYPTEAPGGWRLIGQTPLRPFDLKRPVPFLFKPGDIVRFEAVSFSEFQRMSGRAGPDSPR